jgi:hypothetical protein
MDTCECSKSPNGPAWGGQRRWARRLGRLVLYIGLAIIVGGPARVESQERTLPDAGRMPDHHGKDCKKSENCPTTVRQLGPLDSIIADDILQQVNAVPFTVGHHTPILLQGKMLSGLTKREKRSLKRTYRAGYTIVLLDATAADVAALHEIIKGGVISSSKDGAGVLAYSLRQENHVPTATLLSNVHRSPLHTSQGDPDPTGLEDEKQAHKRAAALTVSELEHRPMRTSRGDPDPTDLKDEEQEDERATEGMANDIGRRPNVRMLQPRDPNQQVDWQSSPVQKTVFQQNGAAGVYNTTVNLYALHSCQPDIRTGLTSDYYMVTALADWTPTNAKFQSAWTGFGDTSMYYDALGDDYVVANWRDDPQRNQCSSPSSVSDEAAICRYINYPLQYDVTMKPKSTGSIVQINAKPPASQGQATTYTSGFMFNLGGTVNVSGPGVSAGVVWNNLTATTVPPLELDLSQTDNEGAQWTFKYCTGGEEPDDGTNCTSHVQTAKDVCRAQLGDNSGTNPQQGQTPHGAFTDAVQTALWQAGPDTRGGTTFDIEVTVAPNIGITTANLWGSTGRDMEEAGCNQFNCECVSKTTTNQLPGGSYIFKIPLPSTTCQ